MKEKVISAIQNACALAEEVSEESELGALSLDSLTFVGVLVELESEFGVEFGPDELDMSDKKTVGDVVRAVEEKCKKEH